jgi:hypothetical protein
MLGQADVDSATTHGPIYPPREDLTAPVVSLEAGKGQAAQVQA